MNDQLRSTALVSIYVFAGQLMTFASQIIAAYLFGVDAKMDAFNAAIAMPQYITVVLLGSLGFVFLPSLMDYTTSSRYEEAWRLTSNMINFCILVTGVMVLTGMLAPQITLDLVAPGLTESTRELALSLSMILWPSVLATGLIIIFTGIYHSESRFSWPALVPVIGTCFGLLITLVLASFQGIFAIAFGFTGGLVLQVFLLAPIAFQKNRYALLLEWDHAGVQQVFRLLFPLVLASVFGKATAVVERFLASSMPSGSISYLTYALRLANMISLFFSSGVSIVIFQKMALDVNSGDLTILRRTISLSVRYLFLLAAPALTIGFSLSLPLVMIVFQRGEFTHADAVVVSQLFQIYMFSLVAACLGNITARGFYVLKDTRTLSWMVVFESVLYVIYTIVLARQFGPPGIALGYVLLFNGSLIWQSILIAYRTGGMWGWNIIKSFLRIFVAALLGGIASWGVLQMSSNQWVQILSGSTVGLIVYLLALWAIKSSEIRDVIMVLGKNILTEGR